MQRLFIRGGWVGVGTRDLVNYTGLPSRSLYGPFFFRFPVDNRHTAYEWAMVLADRHPYPPHIFVLLGDLKAATVAGMQSRKRAIEKLSDQANAIYRELKTEAEAGHVDPLRREWCTDSPDLLDFTRCVFSVEQVLPIVRRRRDTGWLIGKLLAADSATARAPGGTAQESLRPAAEAAIYEKPPTNRRGPKPERRLQIQSQMLADIQNGVIGARDFAHMKQEALSQTYCASRDTVRKARNNVLKELQQNSDKTPTIDK